MDLPNRATGMDKENISQYQNYIQKYIFHPRNTNIKLKIYQNYLVESIIPGISDIF